MGGGDAGRGGAEPSGAGQGGAEQDGAGQGGTEQDGTEQDGAGQGGTERLGRLDEAMVVLASSGLELSREELLDALWLAGRLPEDGVEWAPLARAVTSGGTALPATRPETARPPATASPAASAQPTPEPTAPARTPEADGPGAQPSAPAKGRPDDPPDQPRPRPRGDQRLRGLYGGSQGPDSQGPDSQGPDTEGAPDARRALPLRVPEDKALRQELSIGRALRPLKQHRPNPLKREFDEAATATALAETGLPDVVTRPARERWLDLALVIDDGMSMLLWRRLAVELRTVLQRSGAFRVVRVLGLHTRGAGAPALRARPYAPDAPRLPTTALSDPSGHTLVLVVSDGVGGAWRDGRMGQVLARWAGVGPTAVVHALPPRLWEGSGIRARRWQVRTRRPGSANTDWTVADPVLPAALARFEGVPVPVLEPDAGPLADWARLIASASGTAVLPLLDPGRGGPRPGPAATAPGPAATPTPADELSRVQRFRDAASPEAYRLAAHLAAVAPLPVPVMRMVQKAVDGRTDTGRLAEVFLGGLMHPVEPPASAGPDPLPPEHRPFTFADAAQRALLGAVPLPELVATSRLIGQRLEQLAGRSPDFPAWLAHSAGSDRLPPGARPFTAVEQRLAARLGAPPQPSLFTTPTAAVQWRRLEPRDPRVIGPYRLRRAGPWGARVVPYLGRDAYGEEAVVTVLPGLPAPQAAALLGVQAEALRRMDGRHAPRLLREGLDEDVPWVSEEAFLGHRLHDVLFEDADRWDGHTALALARRIADAVRVCAAEGMTHGDLTVHTVHVAGEDIFVTGWSSACIDGAPSPSSLGHRRPTPEDNVGDLGDILLCLGGGGQMYGHGQDAYDMPRWSGAAWQPVRGMVMACLERQGRPTAARVWEFLTDFRPDAGTPESSARRPRTERPIVCARCGSPLAPDDRFCDTCGGDVLTTPPQSAPPDSARASRPEPGSALPSINAYRAYRRLGGSRGDGVYLARRPGASNDVVIRIAPDGTAQGAGRRLRAEADALRRMAGHYAPRLFVDASSLNPPGLVVECVRLPDGSPAPPLSSLMGRRPDGSPRLDAVRAATIGLRIAEAVNMCSLKGVVPGPLTADTVLVTDSTVKLIGWTDASIGDRLPGAPTAADSVYALGQILRDLSDAQPTGDLIRTIELWRNPQLLSTISACLDDRPGRRPSAGRVADVFVQCLATMPTSMSYEAETSDTPQPPAETPDAEPGSPADPGPALTTAPEPPPKRSGPAFTRALRSLFQRGGSAPEADVAHKLEQVRLPRTDSCHLAVISRAVGAGRTTTAIALGDVLASAHQGEVIAVDAIPGGDALSRRVQRESEATVHDVAQAVLFGDFRSARRFTSQTPGGLEVLAGDPRPSILRDRNHKVDNREYRTVIAALRRRYPVILSASDTGGLRDFVPELLDLTDQLIIVTSPSVERMRSAHTTLDRLIEGGRRDLVQRGIVVLNTHRENPPADPEGLAAGFRVRCRGVVVVPYDQHLAAPGEIDLHRLAPRTLDAYLELAALVAEDYPGARD
ncbi:SAV_2336 N-terminal domain-related protein [Streptomyces violaceusniger]|uniref:SAV_2336 N-terminal domain-related protein n=1 Tax=Streptomyces violaceusniger TaxID=68280 RepID=UPI0009986BD5|nr:SAV_2336 N-terminal domain-related protein [Streptomyces hygroscopicus]AQW49437.1 aromatic ring-opening dioxygenase LigA [Streptomyces hygroscopicus]